MCDDKGWCGIVPMAIKFCPDALSTFERARPTVACPFCRGTTVKSISDDSEERELAIE